MKRDIHFETRRNKTEFSWPDRNLPIERDTHFETGWNETDFSSRDRTLLMARDIYFETRHHFNDNVSRREGPNFCLVGYLTSCINTINMTLSDWIFNSRKRESYQINHHLQSIRPHAVNSSNLSHFSPHMSAISLPFYNERIFFSHVHRTLIHSSLTTISFY